MLLNQSLGTGAKYATNTNPSVVGVRDNNLVYSVRKVVPNYTGYAMRIRRSSDDAEADISYDSSNKISASSVATLVADGSTSTLGTFTNSTDAFVTVWYNQCKNVNKSITGVKAVTFNEPHFHGHFPGHPVMPGVLILESMAQTAACLVSYEDQSLSSNNLVFFTGIEKAKFRKPVVPSNELILKINLISNKRSLYKFNGNAFVQNKLVASSEFSAMLVNEEKAK